MKNEHGKIGNVWRKPYGKICMFVMNLKTYRKNSTDIHEDEYRKKCEKIENVYRKQ